MGLFGRTAPQAIKVKGHELVCPVCANKTFWTRNVLLNKAMSTFFNLDWANRSATCLVCSNCSYIHWFLA